MAKESRNDRRLKRHERVRKNSPELLKDQDFAFTDPTRTFQLRSSTM